ncbi:MAG: twin-arginine translocase TatA/TatE family subunit [Nitrospirae bacterium]|jgi:sec-independent protein translocase protein TatA|nr:twin-arginine translocase TatA/TatE family subunit [Nitrospirota bacterium]MCL5420998.1 twin-arginine translocase TatA/TatE family subunit [Nitrospirota bacterium]
MFGLGMQELVIILIIVLVLFGATRLPEIGKGIGQAIRNFKKATSEPDEIDITPKKPVEEKKEEKKEESK